VTQTSTYMEPHMPNTKINWRCIEYLHKGK